MPQRTPSDPVRLPLTQPSPTISDAYYKITVPYYKISVAYLRTLNLCFALKTRFA